MTDRRINLNSQEYQHMPLADQIYQKPHNKLKAVTGLLQGLSYRDMHTFANECRRGGCSVAAEDILAACDAILARKDA